jgi:hypothetical protein
LLLRLLLSELLQWATNVLQPQLLLQLLDG